MLNQDIGHGDESSRASAVAAMANAATVAVHIFFRSGIRLALPFESTSCRA
jgi:hypothetical protein